MSTTPAEETVAEPETPPAAVIAPVTASSRTRVIGLDTVRGFALLGILMLNIVDFGWPNQAYDSVAALYYTPGSIGPIPEPDQEKVKDKAAEKKDEWKSLERPGPDLKQPSFASGEVRVAAVSSGWDVTEWAVANVFFANKMRTLFCIMFGAGMIYLTQRSIDAGRRPIWLYYRRMFILLIIGGVHGYLIWHGDILFDYAAIGLYLYPFRRCSPTRLLWISFGLFLGFVSLMWVGTGVLHHVRTHGAKLERRVIAESEAGIASQAIPADDLAKNREKQIDARKAAVNRLSGVDQLQLRAYLSLKYASNAQKPEELTRVIRLYGQGSYFGMVRERAKELVWMHIGMLTPLSFLFLGWLMILGMSLAKTGFFAGAWPVETYRLLAFRLLPLGWVIEAALMLAKRYFPMPHPVSLTILEPLHQAVIPMESLGYASALILAIGAGRFTGLTNRLASVGRMALSNYLAQSLICTFLFYSYGLGLFGRLPRVWLVVVVLAVWALELWWSPRWLATHTFGPVEWFWRSLTYRKWQPYRKESAVG